MQVELDQSLSTILTYDDCYHPANDYKFSQFENLDTLGKRLKWAREFRNLSQEQLATTSITSQSLVASIELGKRLPRDGNLAKLSMRLSVSFTWLKTGNGHPFEEDVLMDSYALSLLKISDIKERVRLAYSYYERDCEQEVKELTQTNPELAKVFAPIELPQFAGIAGMPLDEDLHRFATTVAFRFEWLKFGEGSPFLRDSREREALATYVQNLPLGDGDVQLIYDIVRLAATYIYVKNKTGSPPDRHIFKSGALEQINDFLISHKEVKDGIVKGSIDL